MQGDRDITYSLIWAAREGNLERVEELISKFGLSYSQEWSDGYVLLRDALLNKHTEVAKLLITSDSKVNRKDAFCIETPLYYAIRNGDVEIVEMLLDRGAIPDTDYGNTNLLYSAVEYGYTNDAEQQLEHQANVDAQDKNDVLRSTVTNRGTKIFKMLLDRGASVEARSTLDNLLFEAVMRGYENGVKLLLKFGANVDSKDDDGNTALRIAFRNWYLGIVKNPFNFSTSINSEYEHCKTARRNASKKRIQEIVKILLKFGANIDAKDDNNKTALHIASTEEHVEIVEFLLKFGASIDSKDGRGRTALYIASQKNNLEIVESLLKFGASIDSKDNYGKTALHIASQQNYPEIVKSLLKFGASIDSKDNIGRTALHIASENKDLELVEILLIFSVSIDSKDMYGRTALHIASEQLPSTWKHKTIVKILKLHMIKVKIANLYAGNIDSLSISSDDNLSDFKNKCEKEVANMKSEKVGNSNTSFFDILTKGISQLAVYARNKSIVHVFRSYYYKKSFPIYATMINTNFRKGERRKVLMEQGNKIFHFLFTNFLGIPYDCIGKIFTYLSDDDLRSIMVAYKLISVSSPNTNK